MMPDKGTSKDEDLNDALELCDILDVSYDIIDISTTAKNIIKSYPEKIFPGTIPDINIRPRLRMLYLYLCANKEHRLVAGTSNLTEISIGYSTKWGDGAADFLPIGGLWKTEVFRLSGLLGIPAKIRNKKPSAGLYIGQTDEGELGASYEIIDDIIYESIVNSSTRSELYRLYDKAVVDSLLDLVQRNSHKRSMPQSLEVFL
jgi:NAD+ synthase